MVERLYSYGKNRTDFYGLAERLKNFTEWRMGSMHSEGPRMPGYWTEGILPQEYRASCAQADYVVYSYNTPIAWHRRGDYGGDWVMPDVKYSRTTTVHQGKIAVALSVMEHDYAADIR